MAMVRDNPLPIGRYWQSVVGEEAIARWVGWARGLNSEAPKDDPNIRITHRESNPAADGAPPSEFVIFEVLHPVVWNHQDVGIPNSAGPEVESQADTVQTPPADYYSTFGAGGAFGEAGPEIGSGLKKAAWLIGGGLGILGLAILLKK